MGLRGEMRERVDTLAGGSNGVQAHDVGAMAGHAVDGTPVERGELEAVAGLLPERAADEPAQARDEYARLRHCASPNYSRTRGARGGAGPPLRGRGGGPPPPPPTPHHSPPTAPPPPVL